MKSDCSIKETLENATIKLNKNYKGQEIFTLDKGVKLPDKNEIINIIYLMQKLIFPGFFGEENPAIVNLNSFAGNTLAVIYEKLYEQIKTALSFVKKDGDNSSDLKAIEKIAEEIAISYIKRIPVIQELLLKDVEAELSGDPAATSKEEIILSYPGLFAIMVYRMSHELYELRVPFLPRIMTEYVHGKTGIDINPGAKIGEYFFIDHGTGIVIGETTEIGNNVKIYQGVTLGALSTMKGQLLSGVKRHPTIEDNVVIYANATVLGGATVIGKNSVIAGNTFITESIPENTKVSALMPELKIKNR